MDAAAAQTVPVLISVFTVMVGVWWDFSDSIRPIANFLLILAVNNFVNRLIFDKVKTYEQIVPNFWGNPV